jgi:DNA-binding protein
MKLNAIHIFAYGETQIISDEVNFKATVSSFTKLQDVIDNVKSLKPTDVETKDYHVINIFSEQVQYNSKEKKNVGSFKLTYEQLNQTMLNDLIEEFKTLKAASEVTNP